MSQSAKRATRLPFTAHISSIDSVRTIQNPYNSIIVTMSSIIDALINSDNLASDLGVGRKGTPQAPNGHSRQRSSPRPQGPPSESNGHLSDAEGFPDDEVVGLRGTDRNRPRNPMDRAVPKVVDEVGEKVAEEFERFLDQLRLLVSMFIRAAV